MAEATYVRPGMGEPREDGHVSLRVAGGPGAARNARSQARGLLEESLSSEELDDVMLVISELVTNAVRHGGAGRDSVVDVELSAADAIAATHAVMVEVHDLEPLSQPSNGDLARARDGGGGMGLRVVAQLCTDWGTRARDGGKSVWAEYRLA
jgi:anti-sigma regulatory factor (Ser/Thr protein kinase)